jgi:hypothetical protein
MNSVAVSPSNQARSVPVNLNVVDAVAFALPLLVGAGHDAS